MRDLVSRRAPAAVRVAIGVNLVTSNGTYVDTSTGPWVTHAANAWTEFTVGGSIQTTEVSPGMERPLKGDQGHVIYWDAADLVS
jgi:hypothetical protein